MTKAERERRVQSYLDKAKDAVDLWRTLHPEDADQALLEVTEYAAERRFEAQDAAARTAPGNDSGPQKPAAPTAIVGSSQDRSPSATGPRGLQLVGPLRQQLGRRAKRPRAPGGARRARPWPAQRQ